MFRRSDFAAFDPNTRALRSGDAPARAAGLTAGGGLGYAAISRYLSSPLMSFSPGLGLVSRAAIPFLGSALAISAMVPIANAAYRSVRFMSGLDRSVRQLNMGGSYHDTDTSYALRMRAIEEMNGAMQNSRRWLGREALILHH